MRVIQLVRESARRNPAAPALLAPGREPLSYPALQGLLEMSLGRLRAMGVGPADRVALVLSGGPEMAASFLAISAAAACAPLNPAYRAVEFDFYFSDLKPKLLIVEAGLESAAAGAANALGLPVVELAPLMTKPAGSFELRGTTNLAGSVAGFAGSEDVALVLHTSGTTSRPKVVPLTQANLCCSALTIARSLSLDARDRCLNAMPLFHVHGLVGALLASIAAGGSVICPPGFHAPSFFGWLAELEPTWYTAVPAMHQAVLARAAQNAAAIERSRLRFVRSCSAPLSPQTMARLEQALRVPVVEAYGMTEAAHQMASNPLPPGQRKPGSVGVATGAEIAIMDGSGALVEPGRLGEVVIRGPNVTRGYENNPEANRDAFVNGWFRTGDQGWMDSEGYLFLTGRTKEIINRGGEKISPREIDEVLLEHPAVEQALAFSLPDERLGEDMAAAVVLRGDEAATEADLRGFAASRLADFKVPRRIVFLEEIPKGPTGKPQRIGLAEKLGLLQPGSSGPARAQLPVKPRTETEEALAAIWREVLGLESVGVNDNFLEAGGDSILAARLAARVRQRFGAGLTLLQIFDAPTVAAMAGLLEACGGRVAAAAAAAPLISRSGDLPLSFGQERIFFLTRLLDDSRVYNRTAVFRLQGRLDHKALAKSLTAIVERHESLRTTFRDRGGALVQVIRPTRPVPLPVLDPHRASAECRKPFALDSDLMLRASLVKQAGDDHLLYLTMHHIVSDARSTELLLDELAEIYTALVSGRPPAPRRPAIQYADFAAWQRERLPGPLYDGQLSYWTKRLAGAPDLLQIPADAPRPARMTHRGARESLTLPPNVAAELKALSIREGATLFMTLLAAFKALLHSVSGAGDVVVGTPVSGRSLAETEPLIGLLVNMLALRTSLADDPTFRQLLGRVRENSLNDYAHQDLPFEKLVEALQPVRAASHTPVFQVTFQLRPPARDRSFAGLRLSAVDFDPGTALVDLQLEVREHAGSAECLLIYSTDLFLPETARRMLSHYRNLLAAAARDPNLRVSRLPLLEEAERKQIIVEWNDTRRDYPPVRVEQLVEAQTKRTPGAVAVEFEERQLSYREMHEQSGRLARRLAHLGVQRNDKVGVLLNRSAELPVALLGVLKAAAAYVPLSPSDPAARLDHIVEDAAVKLVVTQKRLAAALSPGGPPIVCIDDAAALAAEDAPRCDAAATTDDLAYVTYTSGSTGRPKGAEIRHQGVVNYLDHMIRKYGLGTDDVVLQLTPVTFDPSVREIFGPLAAGAKLVMLSDRDAIDPARILAAIGSRRVTCLLTVLPAMLRELVRAAAGLESPLDSLRLILSSGEMLRKADCESAWRAFGSRVCLVNQYGPSECTMIATCYQVGGYERGPHVPVGRPIQNVQAYIVDHHLNPVATGRPGEILLAGVGLARGYLGRPDLTAEKFIPHPFSGIPGDRAYRTGDLACYLPDGNIEILGRLDNQVKVRGYRVEVEEVESVLAEHPAVESAALAAWPEASGDNRLVAYVVSAPGQIAAEQELRAHLKARVPDYMIPSGFVQVGNLPRLANGKIARRNLPAVPPAASPARPQNASPRTPTEEALARIWSQLLKIDRIGIHDDFFHLGGHSLAAMRVAARLYEQFAVEIPVQLLFEATTIAQLSAVVDEKQRRGTTV